ncbi:MAG: Phosphotransferase enzyme family protein [Ilumatobacteraceae bacterium]|nr:Phosphotransferase enzyme family protein [Ilumatobacteraceae bacterium]
MNPTIPIADTPDALTPDWLTAALGASGRLAGAVVVAAELTPVGTGQMCDSVRISLQYDQPTDAPSTVIAKLPAADETSRATAKALRSYENEVRFYQQLAPGLPVRTPGVFHADIDVDTASFVLLMEDLAPARQGDQLAGCTPDVAQVAVDQLVQLHAPRWDDPALTDIDWLHTDRALQSQFLCMLLPGLWDGFRDRYAVEMDPVVHEAGNALFGALPIYFGADTEPWTIVHGDYRLDNLLFREDPSLAEGLSVTVVDWQTCTHGPAMQDVAYFIGAGMQPSDRRHAEADLVRGYHARLLAAGVQDYGWDQCYRDYRRSTWAGLVMAVAASMLVERTDRGDEMFLTMATRHSMHALDLDAVQFLRA